MNDIELLDALHRAINLHKQNRKCTMILTCGNSFCINKLKTDSAISCAKETINNAQTIVSYRNCVEIAKLRLLLSTLNTTSHKLFVTAIYTDRDSCSFVDQTNPSIVNHNYDFSNFCINLAKSSVKANPASN
jgi:hypothetical protein